MNWLHVIFMAATVVALLLKLKYYSGYKKYQLRCPGPGAWSEGVLQGCGAACDRSLRRKEDPHIFVDNESINSQPHD